MQTRYRHALSATFLGEAPNWYKCAIIACLIVNPILFALSPFWAGWLLVAQFIGTLAMALKCYPLQPGGLLALEAIAIGMASPHQVLHELQTNLEVLLLLVFMVAGIYFMKQLLLLTFTKILLGVKSKTRLALAFCFSAALLSAFLDALTVIAVIISVAVGFYAIYHRVVSGSSDDEHDHTDDKLIPNLNHQDLAQYRAFLRSLLMHAGIGSALGGVITLVGEPQNVIIAHQANWAFGEFILRMSPVTVPALIGGLLTCTTVEKLAWFGYGATLPDKVRTILLEFDRQQQQLRKPQHVIQLWAQGLVMVWLITGLAMHLAAVGLIGLSVIILATSLTGVTHEHTIGKAFEEALPFTALLAVFFSVVAVIINQQLFAPIIDYVLQMQGSEQLTMFYLANGLLSMVSDNVFVGTVYINEVQQALMHDVISRDQFDLLAVAINVGTNLPSVATPNGQAAFLLLLTSALAPLIRLSYGRMVYMALPYTLVLMVISLFSVHFLLAPATEQLYQLGLLSHHSAIHTTAQHQPKQDLHSRH